MKRKMLLFTLALPVILLQNAQGQTFSRLIAESHWQTNGISFSHLDSTDYKYSNGRGGSRNLSPTNIDPISNNPLPMQYDNSNTWNFVVDSAYNTLYYFHAFDANNNVISTTTQNPNGTPNTNTLYTYNASNMLTKIVFQTWDTATGQFVSQSEHTYTYNSAGKLYLDSMLTYVGITSSWQMNSLKAYYYDGSLNMNNETDQAWVAGSPVYTNQWARTFSSTNQLLTTVLSTWSGGWVLSTRYTHAYDSTGNPISIQYDSYNTGTSAYVPNLLYTYSSFTGSHLPQTGYLQTWNNTGSGAWVNSKKYNYGYNSFNQLLFSTGISWNISSGAYQYASGDPLDNYYYQLYSAASVKSITGAGGEANIYPVPAQNMLHVDLNWNEAQSATITILDMTGSIVRQWNAPSGLQYNSAVSVNNLATGMYIVKITGEKGQIVKQIIVAH